MHFTATVWSVLYTRRVHTFLLLDHYPSSHCTDVLWRWALIATVPECQKLKMVGRLGLYGSEYSKCNHMMTLGFKGLRRSVDNVVPISCITCIWKLETNNEVFIPLTELTCISLQSIMAGCTKRRNTNLSVTSFEYHRKCTMTNEVSFAVLEASNYLHLFHDRQFCCTVCSKQSIDSCYRHDEL